MGRLTARDPRNDGSPRVPARDVDQAAAGIEHLDAQRHHARRVGRA
jgi:hypothetical protein